MFVFISLDIAEASRPSFALLCVMVHDLRLISNMYALPSACLNIGVCGCNVVHYESLARASEVTTSHKAACIDETYF